MKIAGVMQARNYNGRFKALTQLKAVTDFTIVLDDNSVVPFETSCEVSPDVVITKRDELPNWNCTANLTTLFYWAHVMGADWIVRMDDDMLLCEELSTRDNFESLIIDNLRYDILNVRLRDLWGGMDYYRFDGIWSEKRFPLIAKNWFRHPGYQLPDPNRRLHQTIFPPNITPVTRDISWKTVYHTGCMTPDLRQSRVNKYAREDANREYQSDYSYMLNEHGIMLAGVPLRDFGWFNQLLA